MTDALARMSARRPWLTIALWVVVVVVGLGLVGRLLGSATTTEFSLSTEVEAKTAANLLEDLWQRPAAITEVVVVQSDSLTVDDPAFREKVEAVFEEVAALGPEVVTTGRHYYQGSDDSLVSADRMTAIIPWC